MKRASGTSSRRDFLGRLGVASLITAAGAADLQAQDDGHPAPADGPWDVSWTERVKGRYRAVFDSPDIADASAIFRAMVWCDQYQQVYGTPRSDMTAVIVLRHHGLRLALGDAYWKRFEIGKESKVLTGEGKEWAETNPALSVAADTPAQWARYTLPQFIAEGGIALGCGLAFENVVDRIKKADSVSDVVAAQRAREALVPGVLLQPSGIFAVLRAEEAGCKYILGS